MRAGWLVAVISLIACAPKIPALPGQGGPAWVELKSEHFTLWTDASVGRGREIVRDMERVRHVVVTAMDRPSSRATAFAIALRDRKEISVYLGFDFTTGTWHGNAPMGQPGILMGAHDYRSFVRSGVTELVLAEFFPNRPNWLTAGITSCYESVDLESNEVYVKVGIPGAGTRSRLRSHRLPLPVEELFACERDDRCRDDAFYATAWALYSFLLNEHYEQLARYLQYLDALPHAGPIPAWHAGPVSTSAETCLRPNGNASESCGERSSPTRGTRRSPICRPTSSITSWSNG